MTLEGRDQDSSSTWEGGQEESGVSNGQCSQGSARGRWSRAAPGDGGKHQPWQQGTKPWGFTAHWRPDWRRICFPQQFFRYLHRWLPPLSTFIHNKCDPAEPFRGEWASFLAALLQPWESSTGGRSRAQHCPSWASHLAPSQSSACGTFPKQAGAGGAGMGMVSTSNAPAELQRVQVLSVSLTELLFLFSWRKVHFSTSSCCVTSSSCSQVGKARVPEHLLWSWGLWLGLFFWF